MVLKNCGGLSQGLVVAAAGLSVSMARCLSCDELAVLGAFFTVLGDNLSLLSIQPSESAETQSCPCSGHSTGSREAPPALSTAALPTVGCTAAESRVK